MNIYNVKGDKVVVVVNNNDFSKEDTELINAMLEISSNVAIIVKFIDIHGPEFTLQNKGTIRAVTVIGVDTIQTLVTNVGMSVKHFLDEMNESYIPIDFSYATKNIIYPTCGAPRLIVAVKTIKK